MNEHAPTPRRGPVKALPWRDLTIHVLYPLAFGLTLASLGLAIAGGDIVRIVVALAWLTVLALPLWFRRWLAKMFDRPAEVGRILVSVELPSRWNMGAVLLAVTIAVLFGIELLDPLVAGEPLQRSDIDVLALSTGILAIQFGWRYVVSSDRFRFVLVENGLVFHGDNDPFEGFLPWEDVVDYYWRTRGDRTILFFHVSRYPSGPPVAIPQLGSIDLGPIDDQTREQLDAVLRQQIPRQSAEAHAE